MSDEQASEGKWDSINRSNSSVYGSHSPCDLPHFNFNPANYVAYMLKNIKTRLDWWWVALKNNRKQTQWQTRFVREAGCIGRSKSRCSVTGLPTDAAHQRWGKGTRAKGEGGWLVTQGGRREGQGFCFLLYFGMWRHSPTPGPVTELAGLFCAEATAATAVPYPPLQKSPLPEAWPTSS